jgi:hypothetical protein
MSEHVMNNNDLRRIILSYFRTEPQISCHNCKKVCLWNDKIINKYMTIPILDHTVIFHQCMQCYWYSGTRDIFS